MFSPGFILHVSEISKFGITQIYQCRTMANAICISIYRLTCYRYFAHVLSAHAFRVFFLRASLTMTMTIYWSHVTLSGIGDKPGLDLNFFLREPAGLLRDFFREQNWVLGSHVSLGRRRGSEATELGGVPPPTVGRFFNFGVQNRAIWWDF